MKKNVEVVASAIIRYVIVPQLPNNCVYNVVWGKMPFPSGSQCKN